MSFDQHVPMNRNLVTGPVSWVLWALFGNDDDGLYGPHADKSFWSWWWRNRWHNLCFRVLRRRVINPIYVVGKPIVQGLPFAEELERTCVLRFRPFFIKLGPFFLGWRADKPHPLAWDGKYGTGGGAFDIGVKRLG